jgi:hypothetical protein
VDEGKINRIAFRILSETAIYKAIAHAQARDIFFADSRRALQMDVCLLDAAIVYVPSQEE